KMGSSYGIRGWLRVFSSTEDAESIFDYQPWFIQKAGQWQQVHVWALIAVIFWQAGGGDWVARLVGASDEVPISAARFWSLDYLI
ncbi:hypothetical protein MJL33_31070, partial [Salmonella enterica subsp. enterica serovar Kentucky]|nr:hypothetical protein [Salmonella enterica subsp. enterica serovar Kentucky]